MFQRVFFSRLRMSPRPHSHLNQYHVLLCVRLGREHEGSLVRRATHVFLDVTWLAKIPKPLLNHWDDEDPFDGNISLGDMGITLDDDEHIACWNRFKESGILELALARVLWPDGLSHYVPPKLRTLGLKHALDGDAPWIN